MFTLTAQKPYAVPHICHYAALSSLNKYIRFMNIVVCDDSKIARKSIIRHIDASLDINILQAENGKEALELLVNNPVDLMFLDLTMPVMDGFETLASLPVSSHQTNVIVVSADIQTQAKLRCMELGAKAFLDKPFAPMDLAVILDQYLVPSAKMPISKPQPSSLSCDPIPYIKEMSNVALGTSAALISDQLGRFIEMPLPNVATLHQSELRMTMQDIVAHSDYRAVAQRFVGNGINGEALVCIRGEGLSELPSRIIDVQQSSINEIILDLSNLVVSSFLVSFSQQLDISISLRQPLVLEKELLQGSLSSNQFLANYEQDIFTIEFVFHSEDLDIACDVIFLMDSDSLNAIANILETVL